VLFWIHENEGFFGTLFSSATCEESSCQKPPFRSRDVRMVFGNSQSQKRVGLARIFCSVGDMYSVRDCIS
jgi:hypothetical protein